MAKAGEKISTGSFVVLVGDKVYRAHSGRNDWKGLVVFEDYDQGDEVILKPVSFELSNHGMRAVIVIDR